MFERLKDIGQILSWTKIHKYFNSQWSLACENKDAYQTAKKILADVEDFVSTVEAALTTSVQGVEIFKYRKKGDSCRHAAFTEQED